VREVEVKFLVRDTETLLAALEARGIELSAPVRQDDQAFAPVGWCYGQSKLGEAFARLRTADGRHTFTLKRPAENALSGDTRVRPRVGSAGAQARKAASSCSGQSSSAESRTGQRSGPPGRRPSTAACAAPARHARPGLGSGRGHQTGPRPSPRRRPRRC
jgi:hypothetical protein